MKLIDERATSEMTDLKVQTLRNHRAKGVGLPYVKLGRAIRYSLDDIQRYIEAHRVQTDPA